MRNRRAELLGRIKGRLTRSMSEAQKNALQAKINRFKSLRHPARVAASAAAIDSLLAQLRLVAETQPVAPGCGYLNFVYGFKDQDDFPYYAFMAIKSAQAHNPNWPAVFVCVHEPKGQWWDAIKDRLILIKMPMFDYFRGSLFLHYAHKADVVRLLMLNEIGGVYLDIDTITVRSYSDLLDHDFGMAVQASVNNTAAGLCNAVMWGKANAFFCRTWIEQYSYFKSRGRDDLWDFHSVKLPGLMARQHADKITILNHRAFFYPLWPDMERFLFSERGERFLPYLASAYGFHLWNGATEAVLRKANPDWVASSTSAYAHYARRALGLPEPAPSPAALGGPAKSNDQKPAVNGRSASPRRPKRADRAETEVEVTTLS